MKEMTDFYKHCGARPTAGMVVLRTTEGTRLTERVVPAGLGVACLTSDFYDKVQVISLENDTIIQETKPPMRQPPNVALGKFSSLFDKRLLNR